MTTPAGWYDDGRGAMRWWDGTQWTDHVAPVDATAPVPAAAADSYAPTAPIAPTPPYVMPAMTAEYPGAYRPYDPDAAAAVYTIAPAPRSSKAWIWWTIGGVVVLGLIITAAVLIPLLLLSAGGGASGPSPAVSSVEDDGTPSSADEDAATAAVELYDDAWRLADCEDFFATTTEEYREYNEWVDCESFYSASRNFYGGVEDFEMEIREVETVGGAIAVSVTESYSWLYDEDGAPLEEPEPYEDRWEYLLVEADGAWVIDEAFVD